MQKTQTFAIRLSAHHKPCIYTGEICALWVQLQYYMFARFLAVVIERL